MRVSIQWETTIEHTVSVDVDLVAIAEWALQTLPLGLLVDGRLDRPSAQDVVASMRRNPHLCTRLVQLHEISASTDQIEAVSRRDRQPSTQK